ncbi:PEP-CTERM motif protein [Symmachiella macrocystis]|uniref:PEP-CTERM motif protein n=1 Tax=Symmachiella macrocystis TaxID=2527985 RepID=A0A5C6BIH4_9PLAN|nr:PEP-CTERM sorting domain-containing protein [Symmachiella macrocystis]TWU11858.1 PEP-CTERM motif protein [Symmachiella macrocystis]
MKKSLFVASLVAAALLMPSTKAQAQFGLGFNSPVDMNFSVFDGANGNGNTYNDVNGITRLLFSGAVASNHLGAGNATNGDAVHTVGGVVATGYLTGPTNAYSPLIPPISGTGVGGGLSFLELTATVDATGVMFNVVDNNNFQVALTAVTVNFYVDNIDPAAPGVGNYNSGDASTWVDGTPVATFTLVPGTGVISFAGAGVSGSTEFGSVLTADPVLGFLAGEITNLVGNLLMFVTTDDEPLPPFPGALPSNIDAVFPGFSNGWGTGIDVQAAIDGSSTFDVVPEPSSFVLLSLGGVALVGVAARRRRNAKKAA